MPRAMQYGVSTRALIQRVNRVLKRDGQQIKTARGNCRVHGLGRYYIVTPARSWIDNSKVDLEGLARELKVLAPYEKLADEES